METIVNSWLVIVGVLLMLMALMATVLKRLPLTTSLLYLGVGAALGPLGAGLIALDPLASAHVLERLTEAAVVVSLFTAGLKLRVPFSDELWKPPLRLATLTMVVTIALVAALGVGLLGLPVGAAILLGAVLAPTDPVLASDVQVEHATDRSRLRFSLTGEAGLNDGTAFPFVMLGLGLLGVHEIGPMGWKWLAVDVLWSVVGGVGVGWILGGIVGRLTVQVRSRSEEVVGYDDFLALGLIALSYGLALLLHAYGFLAVFAAAVALRRVERTSTGTNREPEEAIREATEDFPEAKEEQIAAHPSAAPAYMAQAMLGFAEQAERILEFGVVLVLGGLLTYADVGWRSILFVSAMLLLVRPLAVLGTYGGRGTLPRLRPYVAWFGIRGIGSLYYLFYAVSHGLPKDLGRSLLGVTLATVAVSVVVHGVSVTPIMRRYARERAAVRAAEAR
ncbi:sodium:proton antiporter [bacterium]|nr:MAG: sodium:proton antiporter [bacterium]